MTTYSQGGWAAEVDADASDDHICEVRFWREADGVKGVARFKSIDDGCANIAFEDGILHVCSEEDICDLMAVIYLAELHRV